MRIIVNGELRPLRERTVQDLLDSLGLPTKGVAVELNRVILRKIEYNTKHLSDGDEIEVVQFVGGG